jgi:hypothetical protein
MVVAMWRSGRHYTRIYLWSTGSLCMVIGLGGCRLSSKADESDGRTDGRTVAVVA